MRGLQRGQRTQTGEFDSSPRLERAKTARMQAFRKRCGWAESKEAATHSTHVRLKAWKAGLLCVLYYATRDPQLPNSTNPVDPGHAHVLLYTRVTVSVGVSPSPLYGEKFEFEFFRSQISFTIDSL